jgi:hypothetical protein
LEATINNLNRELQRKEVEGKDVQRHWINLQTELVAKQNENSALSEEHARISSHYSILFQKKVGLEKSLAQERNEVIFWGVLGAALIAYARCNTHFAVHIDAWEECERCFNRW